MKVIIAGCRHFNKSFHANALDTAIQESGFQIDEVVCGNAAGVDNLGYLWALYRCIPIKKFPAKWHTYGKAAGPIRNGEMAEYADALIALWDGKSRGTKGMIEQAKAKGLKVYVHTI